MRTASKLAPILVCLLVIHGPAAGDTVITVRAMKATTIMEVFVERSTVRVEIEMGLRDAPAFVNLLPAEIYDRMDLPPVSAEERLHLFFTRDMVIEADGTPLIGRLVSAVPRARVVRDEISGEPLPVADEDIEAVVFFVLEYPLESGPRALTFKTPDRETPGAMADLGFVLYHLGVAANDFRYLTTGATVDLDWDDPWHSRFRSRQLRRAYDAPMNVFLYVEPYEVRVEVIVRPLDAQRWVDLDLEGRDTITPEMYGDVQGRVADFLAEHFELKNDGAQTEPVIDRIHFLGRTLRTSTVIDPPEELSVFTAQLGAIFIVPRDGLPQEAEVTWELFSEKIQAVPGAATDEAGPMPYTLTPDDNVLRWQNFLQNPTIPTMVGVETPPRSYTRLLSTVGWGGVLALAALLAWAGVRFVRERTVPRAAAAASVVLAAASGLSFYAGQRAAVDEQRSGRIVEALLHNVYRSFDYRQEGAVYDALARSISGDLLTQVYLETKRSLELRSQGGARVKVNDVDIVDCRPRPLGDGIGFIADCRWNVSGSVGHWGHIHQRRNQYNALVTIRAVDGAWRITGMDLISEDRL